MLSILNLANHQSNSLFFFRICKQRVRELGTKVHVCYFGINVTFSLRLCVWLPKQAQCHTSLLVSLVSAVTSCLYSLCKTRWTIWHRPQSQLKTYDFAENKNCRKGCTQCCVYIPQNNITYLCCFQFPRYVKENPF